MSNQFKTRTHAETETDFWNKVKTGLPDECWEWQGGRISYGKHLHYGVTTILQKKWRAHRFAYFITKGAIPKGLLVCHQCDNPPCCNPGHLFLGTHKDNMLDCKAKDRLNTEKGTERYNSKFTPDDIKCIRSSYGKRGRNGLTLDQLAANYQVSRSIIHAIIHRKRWKHVQ